ncbi:hypothetical protein DFH06DRAFT_1432525, partial [Mycena polygramma]
HLFTMTTMTFAQYATPHPNSPFSAESLRDITVAEASDLIQNNVLPLILPKNTVKISFFDPRVPVDASEITLAPNEVIPCAEDMLPITQAMEAAFLDESARSVCVELPHGYVIYHLSKIRVIMNVNNHMSSLALVARLLAHAKSSSLLLPGLIQELEASRYAEPLAGFHVTETPLYTLGCLLDERWALEDVLNARAELTYFHRAASLELGQDPSLLFIPTLFLNDCRKLIGRPNTEYSQNIIWVRERIRAGYVKVLGFLSWAGEHYSGLYKLRIDELEHGDSMHRPAAYDLLRILRWALAGLPGFEPPADQTYITTGLVDRQTTLSGEGSCGIAAFNFVDFRIGMGTPRWMAAQSAQFRDLFLQDLLLYHLIARRRTTTYSDWVTPCDLASNGEVAGFMPDVAVGYQDYNLDRPSTNGEHPIHDWIIARSQQPPVFAASRLFDEPSLASPYLGDHLDEPGLASPFSAFPPHAHVPPLSQLAEFASDYPFDFSGMDFGGSPSLLPLPPLSPFTIHADHEIIELPDSPSLPPPLPPPLPRTPSPRIKQEVLDLCSPDVIDLCTPPRLATKQEVIELSSPFHAGPSGSSSSRPPPAPARSIQTTFGPVKVGNVYNSLDDAIQAVYQAQEALGHKWIRSQVAKDPNTGAIRRHTLRCNRQGQPQETHRMDIDPADHRQGKSGRTGCQAHVNVSRVPGGGGQWHLTIVDGEHNHAPHLPVGGTIQRPPTAEQRSVVGKFSDFSRKQLGAVLESQFPDKKLESRQISNMRNQARKQAHADIEALGGDVQAILSTLEENNRTGPGWDYGIQMDSQNVVVTLWWQSPLQAQLTGRYTDILINDNSYNRNDKQYSLSIGIVIDSHGRSRNAWYSFQKKEDTETFAWILRRHLKAAGDVAPELFVSDRCAALIAAVALVLLFTYHIYCLSHLLDNIDQNLRRVLGDEWVNFLRDFWACY